MHTPAVIGRLAPSPTGALHLGHALSFLAAWWSARSQGGRIVLRWEDLDAKRASGAHIEQGMGALRWLGIDWDGDPIIQSNRTDQLRRAALELQRRGLAYPCVCTRSDLRFTEETGAPHGAVAGRYPGTCQGRFESLEHAETQTGRESGLRFRVPDEITVFDDLVFGHTEAHVADEAGDFLILRRNKTPAYQLAIVVDDNADFVSEVVRGRDLLESTARQILIADALGIESPKYAHLPLVCDESGRRLAKRDAARSLDELREQGVSKDRILAWAGRCLGQDAPFSMLAQPNIFNWSRVPRRDILLPKDLTLAL